MSNQSNKIIAPLLLFVILFLADSDKVNAQQRNRIKAFSNLSSPEKCWVIFHPFSAKRAYNISIETTELCREYEKEDVLDGDLNGGQLDAFKHAYWMARLTQDLNQRKARRLGKAHEKGNYRSFRKALRKGNSTNHDKTSMEMDLWNNEVGINIGRTYQDVSEEKLTKIIISAIMEGQLKIVKKDSLRNSLDRNGIIIISKKLKGSWENDKVLVPSDISY